MNKDNYEILNEAKLNDTLDKLSGYNILEYKFPANGIDYSNSIIIENAENWFIDLGLGAGFAQYPKCDFSMQQAIEDQFE